MDINCVEVEYIISENRNPFTNEDVNKVSCTP